MKNRRVLALVMAGFVISTSFSPAVLAEDEYFDLSSEVFLLDEAEEVSFDEGDSFSGGEEQVEPSYEEVIYDDTGWDSVPEAEYTDEGVWGEVSNGIIDTGDSYEAFEDFLISDDTVETTTEAPAQTSTELSVTPTPAEEVTPTPIVPTGLDSAKPIYVYTDGEDEEPQLTFTVDTIDEAIAAAKAVGLDMVDISISKNVTIDKTVEIPENMSVSISTVGDFSLLRGAAFTGSFFVVRDGAELTLTGNYEEVTKEDGSQEMKLETLTLDGLNISTIAPFVFLDEGGSLSLENGVVLTRNYSSHQGAAVYVSKDADSLTVANATITNNVSLAEDGAAVYVEEGFAGNFNIGDGGEVTVDGNSRIVSDNKIPANLYLAKAGEEMTQIVLTGDLGENSSIQLSVGNPANGLPVVVDSEDGYVEDFSTSVTAFHYEREGFSLTAAGTLSDGSEPTPTPTEAALTPTPGEGTLTPTPAEGTVTPTPVTVTNTPTTAPISYSPVTATPTTAPTRSYYVPAVSSAADGYLVSGLDAPLEFPAGKTNSFDVTGASAETRYSSNLVVGDGKWSPYYWSSGNSGRREQVPEDENAVYTRRTFNIAHEDGLYNQTSTRTINVYFKLFTWGGTGWIPTSTVQSTQVRFTIAKITPTTAASRTATATPTSSAYAYYTATPTPYNNSNGTVSTNNTTDYLALTRAAQTPGATVVTTASTVNTADESPVGAYVLLAVLSLLGAAFAVIRRRKVS